MARVRYYEVNKMNNIDIQMKEDMHEMKKRMKAMENEITVLKRCYQGITGVFG